MNASQLVSSRRAAIAALAGTALTLAGCATQRVDAQWTDPQAAAAAPLRGARVLVVCEAAEVVLSRICVDKLSADLQARGATVITLPDTNTPGPAPGQAADDSRYVALARTANAAAVWTASVAPEAYLADHRSGPGVSIGLGGFSFGRGGGIGVGVSVPVGGGSGATLQYAANARVTDATNGRLLWTARVGAPPSGDADTQLNNLLQRLVTAAVDARLF